MAMATIAPAATTGTSNLDALNGVLADLCIRGNPKFDPETTLETVRYHGDPQVILAYLKYQWSLGDDHRRKDAFGRLKDLAMDLSRTTVFQHTTQAVAYRAARACLSCVFLKFGTWQWTLFPGLDDDAIQGLQI